MYLKCFGLPEQCILTEVCKSPKATKMLYLSSIYTVQSEASYYLNVKTFKLRGALDKHEAWWIIGKENKDTHIFKYNKLVCLSNVNNRIYTWCCPADNIISFLHKMKIWRNRCVFHYVFHFQALTIQFRLASNSRQACWCSIRSVGIIDVQFHHKLNYAF